MSFNLPADWFETKLGDVCTDPQYGYTTKATNKGSLKLLRTTDITSGRIDWSSVPYCSKDPETIEKYIIKDGDVVIARAGSVGVSYLLRKPERAVFASYLIRFRPFLNEKYFYYFLKSPFFWREISEKKLGITIPNVNATKLKAVSLPLPSKCEQEKVVEAVERLFSDLDNAINNLKKAKDQLKIYRQSVLKYAFEGKLTKKHSVWERMSLSKVCEIKPSKKEVDGLPEEMDVSFLPMPNISESGKIIKHDIQKLKGVRKGYTYFKDGDVLLAKITPCFENGKKAIAENLINGVGFGSTEFHVLRSMEKVLPKWILLTVSLESFRNKAILQMTGAVGQKRVPSRIVEEYEISVPSIEEQKEIVQEIESRFSVCDKMEETIANSLEQADALRQSILKQVFEGKLTEEWRKNNPELINGENSAKALLEKIKAEREVLGNTRKRKR